MNDSATPGSPEHEFTALIGRRPDRRRKGRHSAPPRGRWPLGVGTALVIATASVVIGGAGEAATDTRIEAAAQVPAARPAPGGTVASAPAERTQTSRSGERAALPETLDSTAAAAPASPAPASAAAPSPDAPEVPQVKVEPATVLPGCDAATNGAGTNGELPHEQLCHLWNGIHLRADAAVALTELNQAFTAVFGEALCITDGYRSYAEQVAAKAAKPSLTATPGKSNHGWGLAVDLCPESYAGERWDWLTEHGPQHGWDNPEWARKGGAGPYEPWHWEFAAAVATVTDEG